MPIGLKPNVTSEFQEQESGVFKGKDGNFKKGSHTVTISVSVVIIAAILVLFALLCFRGVRRRRKMAGVNEEKARRESVRQAVRLKLQELEHSDDTNHYLGQVEIKVPFVTFGDVTHISPSHSPEDSPVTKPRRIFMDYPRQEYLYCMLYQQRFHKDGQRRVNHIPYRRNSGQPSFREQQQLRDQQRQLDVHETQEHSPHNRRNSLNSHPHKLPFVHSRTIA